MADYHEMFDVYSKATLFGINAAAKAMQEAGVCGTILRTTSSVSHLVRSKQPLMSLYGASQAAAEAFVKYAAMEYADAGAQVLHIYSALSDPVEYFDPHEGQSHVSNLQVSSVLHTLASHRGCESALHAVPRHQQEHG